MKLNLPNKLTVLRLILIPFCMAVIIYPIFAGDVIWRLIAAALFGLTAFTDMLDGAIARKYNLITDFGKFLDPLADKLLIFGAMLAVMVRFADEKLFVSVFVWAALIVILRETAVTSMRMIASQKQGIVIAAGLLGKIKTVTQMICILTILLEGLLPFNTYFILSYATTAVMTVMTIWSGMEYFRVYWPLLNPEK
ncbi:MAG: CDP-diacylglycerol--glycerol-3-phosphate 3-phosphatidyltransferase [Eubacteriales bacterium]